MNQLSTWKAQKTRTVNALDKLKKKTNPSQKEKDKIKEYEKKITTLSDFIDNYKPESEKIDSNIEKDSQKSPPINLGFGKNCPHPNSKGELKHDGSVFKKKSQHFDPKNRIITVFYCQSNDSYIISKEDTDKTFLVHSDDFKTVLSDFISDGFNQ